MSVIETARLLAASRTAVYDWIKSGKIRVISQGERKRNRGIRLNREDVDALHRERLEELESKLRQARGE